MAKKEDLPVVITGAGRGIGAACALSLDQLGWRVAYVNITLDNNG